MHWRAATQHQYSNCMGTCCLLAAQVLQASLHDAACMAHLFPQKGSATPLDHIELVIDLICSVDGQINVRLLIQGGEGDAQTCNGHRQMSLVVLEVKIGPRFNRAGTHALPAHMWQWTLARLQCP